MPLSLALAAALAAAAPPSDAADWWWIGINGDSPNRVVTYVDLKHVVRQRGALEAWALAIGEKPLPNGQQHQATQYAFKCKARTYSTLNRIGYDASGKRLDLAPIAATKFARVKEGSIGESLLMLVCGDPAGTEIRVERPVEHAQQYMAAEDASRSPGKPPQKDEPSYSVGTGFFVGPNGEMLTSYHVIEGASELGCRTPDGKVHSASVSRVSAANDLALLKVEMRPASYLSLAPRGSIYPGARVFTIGYGAPDYLGVHEPRFTEGSISALSGLGAEDAYMQISVPVQPGNSGGPLINEDGEVVGVIAAQAAVDAFLKVEGTLPQSINWAVKSDYAAPLLPSLGPSPKRSRQQAIAAARDALCLVIAEHRGAE
jgi:S1-C subfamily serine protease